MDIYVKTKDVKGQPYRDVQLYALMLHEIGHALGLGDHSASPADVMYFDGDYISFETVPKQISRRDLNTLFMLYKLVPDVIDIQLSQGVINNLIFHQIITTYPGENFKVETQRLIEDLKNDKTNVYNWIDLAINYAFNKQYSRSNYVLERILPLVYTNEDNQFIVYYNLALNYYRLRDYAVSSKYLKVAENIKEDKDTRTLDAFIDVKQNRLKEAKEKLIELNHEYPKDIEIALKLTEVYFKLKDNIDGKRTIENLVMNNPKAKRDIRVLKYNV